MTQIPLAKSGSGSLDWAKKTLSSESVLGLFSSLLNDFLQHGKLQKFEADTILQSQKRRFAELIIPIDGPLSIKAFTGLAVDSVVVENADPCSVLGLFEILASRSSPVSIEVEDPIWALTVPASSVIHLMEKYKESWKVLRLMLSNKAVTRFANDFISLGYSQHDLVDLAHVIPLTSERMSRFTRNQSGHHVFFIQSGHMRAVQGEETHLYGPGFYWLSSGESDIGNISYLESTFLHVLEVDSLSENLRENLLAFFKTKERNEKKQIISSALELTGPSQTGTWQGHVEKDLSQFPALEKIEWKVKHSKRTGSGEILVKRWVQLSDLSVDDEAIHVHAMLVGFASPLSIAQFLERFGSVVRQDLYAKPTLHPFPWITDCQGKPVIVVSERTSTTFWIDEGEGLRSSPSEDFWERSTGQILYQDRTVSEMVEKLEGRGVKSRNEIARTFFQLNSAMVHGLTRNSFALFLLVALLSMIEAPTISMLYAKTFQIHSSEVTGILLTGLAVVAILLTIANFFVDWISGVGNVQTSYSIYSSFFRQYLMASLGQVPMGAVFLAKPFQFSGLQKLRLRVAWKLPAEIVFFSLILLIIAIHSVSIVMLILVAFAIGMLASYLIVRKRIESYTGIFGSYVRMLESLSEFLTGFSSIRAYAAEKRMSERVEKDFVSYVTLDLKIQRAERVRSLISQSIWALILVTSLLYLFQDYRRGIISAGTLIVLSSFLFLVQKPILALFDMVSDLVMARIEGDGLVPPVPAARTLNAGNEMSVVLNGDISLEKVSFRYPSAQRSAIQDATLQIKPGQVVAIVGKSGSGKTTLARLIGAQITPTNGKILFSGADGREIGLGNLRDQIGYVSQDTHLFSGTLFENISYGDDNPTLDEVRASGKASLSHGFVRSIDNQYFYQLDENGHGISGGERHLLALARTLYRKPRVLVLDEVTSYLDPQSEKLLFDSISRSDAQMTVIYVVHRMNLAKKADVIVVVNNGAICEVGKHDELIRRNGEYTELYRHQLGIQDV